MRPVALLPIAVKRHLKTQKCYKYRAATAVYPQDIILKTLRVECAQTTAPV